MAVKFDLGNGTTAYVEDNAHLIDVINKGMIEAQNVVQGDKICNVAGEPHNEVMSAPVVT
jgi:adenine deaminase